MTITTNDIEMSLSEHLEELRQRMFLSFGVFLAFSWLRVGTPLGPRGRRTIAVGARLLLQGIREAQLVPPAPFHNRARPGSKAQRTSSYVHRRC